MKLNTLCFGILFISITLLGTVAGQISIKKGMIQNPYEEGNILGTLFNGLTNVWVILGLVLAVFAAFAWMITLSRLPLSYAYPFLSITFPIVVILSCALFNEPGSIKTYVGLGIVVAGLIITSVGK